MKKILFLLLLLFPSLSLAQTSEWGLMRKGTHALHAGNLDAAMQCYVAAQKENPKSVRANYNLALVYIAKKDYPGAIEQLDIALKSEQNKDIRSKAFFNRGYVFQRQASDSIKNQKEQGQQEKLRAAIEEYKNALRLNPHDDEARYNLALCQHQLKQDGQQGGGGQDKDKQNQDKKEQGKDKDKKDKENKNRNKDKQEQQKQNKDDSKDKQQQDRQGGQQPQSADPKQRIDMQTQQLLNLTRQNEQRTRAKVNESNRPSRREQQRQSGPNW